MPFAVGAIFSLPMLVFVYGLSLLPPPSKADRTHRTERLPMDRDARIAFVRRFFFGLLCLTLAYILLTAFRDFRDNFAVELWRDMGDEKAAGKLALTEIPVTIGALIALALIMLVRSNRRALTVVHGVMILGTMLVGLSTWLFRIDSIGPTTWTILVGLGLYIAYVPFGCVLFDRLIAALGTVATAGFLIYVTDAFGYLGSVGLLLYKELGNPSLSWLDFFSRFGYVAAIGCTLLFSLSLGYFARKSD